MSRVAAIAWREFKQTVFRKVFLLAVIGLPVLFLGMAVIAGVIMATHQEPALVGTVAIIDPTGELTPAAQIEFDEEKIRRDEKRQSEEMKERAGGSAFPADGAGVTNMNSTAARGEVNIHIERIEADDEKSIEDARNRVGAGELLAVAVVAPHLLDPEHWNEPPEVPVQSDTTTEADDDRNATTESEDHTRYRLIITEDLDNDHADLIERRLAKSIVRVRAKRAGYDPEEVLTMLKEPRAVTKRLSPSGDETDASAGFRGVAQMIPMAFMMLIWIGTMTSSQHLLMTTIEEKSNRVMELLLSAVSPLQLMLGKILGMGGVGLLIVGIYSSVGIAAIIAFAAAQYIDWTDVVYLFVFYFMAYFMIASIMAAVGSAVSDIREANTLVTPVMMIVMVPLFLWFPISNAPNGNIATAFSFIPPAIPFVMILRLAADEGVEHWWQIPASIIWGYICVIGMIWFAAKVFRVGVLMYGKPPSPLQLIKWARYT